ncbi:hypothetical protein ZEAMMB73_Zm00001d032839 [Zea mays]|jgi:hypothetical protein|uniref:Uncharacterized protein n=1 Tax=Zea mays TaxID=4577 RepID=A0A1D6KUD3_MAIZE|nr:hypothetical protein ZEAMMB73_Zm00001d032839 [Zea mays]
MAGDVARRVPRTALQGSRKARRKMAVARLGGSGRTRRRFLGTALIRRLRLRCVAALYRRALRRLRAACASDAVQRVLESAALVGAVRMDAGV